MRTRRILATGSAAVILGIGGIAGAASAATAADEDAADTGTCGYLFDDFSYSSSSDPALTANGWVPRSYQGGPGVSGANWSPDNLSFPTVDGEHVLQLTASTDGTPEGTSHAELYSADKRYFEGTYASRVKFSDAPESGPDGDHVNETFFAISPLAEDMDPTYSEIDISEYLPNGGWGEEGPINYQTTWYTYQNEPWVADNDHSSQESSLDGWHDLVVTVADDHVKYYIDGVLVGDHTGKYYPRQSMTLNWNLWFIDTEGHSGALSTYVEQVDWAFYAKDRVLTPEQATTQVGDYRADGASFVDTVDATAEACTDTASPAEPSTPSTPAPSPTEPTPSASATPTPVASATPAPVASATPTPTPSATASTPTTSPAAPGISLSAATAPAGGGLVVSGSGFLAGEELTVQVHSTPVTVATPTATAEGTFRTDVTVPAGTDPGEHELVVVRADGSTISSPLTITAAQGAGAKSAAELAATGAAVPVAAVSAAGILILLGAVLMMLRRRSQRG